MRTLTILLALLCVGLLFTNPGMDKFRGFVESRSEELLSNEFGDSALGRAASRFGSSLARDLAPRITDRKNYGLFSIYTLGDSGDVVVENGDVTVERSDKREPWRFLGIGGQFIQLSGPAK